MVKIRSRTTLDLRRNGSLVLRRVDCTEGDRAIADYGSVSRVLFGFPTAALMSGEGLCVKPSAAHPQALSAGFRVQDSEFRVQHSGFRVQGSGCRVQGAGCRVQGAGRRVQGAGCRVKVRLCSLPSPGTSPLCGVLCFGAAAHSQFGVCVAGLVGGAHTLFPVNLS